MEGNTDKLRSFKINLDRNMADVMPNSWKGHARLVIRENDDLSDEEKEKALSAVENLSEKKAEYFDKFGAEKVANKVISKLA